MSLACEAIGSADAARQSTIPGGKLQGAQVPAYVGCTRTFVRLCRADHRRFMAQIPEGAHESADVNRASALARQVDTGIGAEVKDFHRLTPC